MKCDGCTFCCKIFSIAEVNSKRGENCDFMCDEGCSRYDDQPIPCSTFCCAYNQTDEAPIELRPDKCGAMFERYLDTYLCVVDCFDEEPALTTISQIKSLVFKGFGVVVVDRNEHVKLVVPAMNHTEKYTLRKFKKNLKRIRNGELYN